MNDFVERCRTEWKRLGVPDGLAQDMASDLASDLSEAEAEGMSSESYLGASAADPRSFARTWAFERGIIPESPDRMRTRRIPRFLLAFTALSATTVVATALLLLTGQPKLAIAATRATSQGIVHRQVLYSTSASVPVEWILLVLAFAALAFAGWLWSSWLHARPSIPAQ